MPRKQKQYHFIYKTTCKVTNRYYYGMHSTNNLEDGYVGSGKRLGYSIRKHGKENHICEKQEFFETREELKQKEIEIVNEDLLKDSMCMNLQPGGNGGGGFRSEEHKIKFLYEGQKQRSIKGNQRIKWLFENDKEWVEKRKKNISNGIKQSSVVRGKRVYSVEAKIKMKEYHKGKHDCNKNRRWISKENIVKRVKLNELNDYLMLGWIIGIKRIK